MIMVNISDPKIDTTRKYKYPKKSKPLSRQEIAEKYREVIETTDNKKDLLFFLRGYFSITRKEPLAERPLRIAVAQEVEKLNNNGKTYKQIAHKALLSTTGLRNVIKEDNCSWIKVLAVLIRINDEYLKLLD